ncbi:GMC family oxidoreductase [Novosphingobium olei]|uniref:GMC family oxidoreductase n=1 Tax=Novosphingobium olei TaxID=2728851 RepID=UPI0030881F82|nr:GMC family oxidoreductase [Novosphingobium olei]
MTDTFDAIVIGSGISGGWAAKELTERGLKVLMIERGRAIEHQADYANELKAPWEMPFRGYGDQDLLDREYAVQQKGTNFDEYTMDHFVNDADHPYQTSSDKPFQWRRGYQLGGRSLTWGRQCQRWSDYDFSANARDGHGTDWPIRYADIAPWYDHVERFIGVNGSHEGLPQLPDGEFQPPMPLSAGEKALASRIAAAYPDRRLIPGRSANLTVAKEDEGRAQCQYRYLCARGCSYGAYFSTQSSTLPAARKTGRLTLQTDMIVERIEHDPKTGRAVAVHCIDARTRARHRYAARIFFLNASSFNSVGVLLRSASEAFPQGLANRSGVLGRFIMDHATAVAGIATAPGLEDRTYFGNRPSNFVIPRFRNLDTADPRFVRGYSYQGVGIRANWPRGVHLPGIGPSLRRELASPGEWRIFMVAFAECLPRADNRVTLSKATDAWGMPQLDIRLDQGENERALLSDAASEARAMLGLLGGNILASVAEPDLAGSAVHEMGGARMGHDPATSVLNAHNQAHDVPNLFVTDGAMMASSACQNPSLTYMALTARAAAYAVEQMQAGRL